MKKAFSVDDTKNDNISLILCQVVAVNKYYPVLPAVPKNSSERRKTVLRAAQWLQRQTQQWVEWKDIKYCYVPPP